MSVAEKIMELRIASRKATMCEGSNSTKSALTLKTKILFLIRNGGLAPLEIMDALVIAKTNLALICSDLAHQGLLTKQKQSGGRRGIVYHITDKGLEYLQKRLDVLEKQVALAFPTKDDYSSAEAKLEDALNVFQFL